MAHVGDARRNDDERFREMIRNITEGRRPDSDNDEHRTRFFEVFRSLEEPDQAEHNTGMSEPLTRPELDAKLKNVELTLDRRIDAIDSKLDGLRGDVASTKSTVRWMTALIIGTIVATAGLVVTSFDSGRDTAEMAAQARADTAAALSEIKKAVDDIKDLRPPPQQ